MSYDYMPLSVYIVFGFSAVSFVIYMIIKRRNVDQKSLLVFYGTLAISACITIGIRILRETSELYLTYYNEIGYLITGMSILLSLEFLYAILVHKKNNDSRRKLKVAFWILMIPLIVCIILLKFF